VELPFQIGALYNRQAHIHGLFGGDQQSGISTPKDHPVIFAFTGEAGFSHGYRDFWDDDGIFHYYGEGRAGNMHYTRKNLAVEQHMADGKKLLIFQMMGKGRPYRYLGEFVRLSSYIQPSTPDTNGALRNAIVFRLQPLESDHVTFDVLGDELAVCQAEVSSGVEETAKKKLVEVRTKQRLFRERLIGIEKGCRITGIEDLRFLRASHMKPWANSADRERIDGQNGLLLTPHVDLLFDRGWISFEDSGCLLISRQLPPEVEKALGLGLNQGRRYGSFKERQKEYMRFHRDVIFEKSFLENFPPDDSASQR